MSALWLPIPRVAAVAALLAPACLWAQTEVPGAKDPNPREEFAQANQLYEQSQYEAAITRYESLLKRYPDNPYLHYNLGNAYIRSGKSQSLGRAIASYQRAFQLAPRNSDIRYNLDFALQNCGESLIPTGLPTALFILFHMLSADELAAMHWLAFWICLVLASIALLKENVRRHLRAGVWASLALWLMSASWWGLRRLTQIPSPGVIVAQDAEVRSGPGQNFPVNFKAPEGRRISILGEKEGWAEIGVLKEGLRGWLPTSAIERI